MYIPTPNAEQISRAAWRDLRERPSLDGKPNVTTHWWSVITHPVTGETALRIDPDEAFQIKPDGKGDDFIPLMNIPTQAERDKGIQDIAANRGRRVSVSSLLPDSIQGAAKTREQMAADGWFDEQG